MSISSMQGRFPFFSLGTSAKHFGEKKNTNWTFIHEKILVYFSYEMRAISFIYLLKEPKIQMYWFWPESIQELFNITGEESCLLYGIKTKQTQVAISTPMVTFFPLPGFPGGEKMRQYLKLWQK